MSKRERTAISERELHAFVDGQLSPERQAAVEAWLKERPDEAATVAAWRAQNEAIRQLFSAEPLSGQFDHQSVVAIGRPQRAWWKTAAAAFVIFIAGVAAGSFLPYPFGSQPSIYVETLPKASLANYRIYTNEVRHPVEVGADQEDHLVGWLGKRIGLALAAPKLDAHGFRLVGGRLVPFDGRPGAMLMYENGSGQRLTVMIGTNTTHEGTNFRFEQADGVGTFYWIEDHHGYALSGALPREQLLTLATAIHSQQ